MSEQKRWIAIGDSFTFMNDHPENTLYRVKKGYLDRVLEQLPGYELINIGIDGSTTSTWVMVNIPRADLYTILLGTNDWFMEVPLGTDQDFDNKTYGTTLGNLGIILDRIHRVNPQAEVVVMNPVERGDFVCVLIDSNIAHNSTIPHKGVMLSEVAAAIVRNCRRAGIPSIDLHEKSGFSAQNAVKFKHVRTPEGYQDLPWPEYTKYEFHPGEDEFPYPPEASWMTYDGLHPSDEGNEIIARILTEEISKIL